MDGTPPHGSTMAGALSAPFRPAAQGTTMARVVAFRPAFEARAK
jgi:hypothetical protein